MDKTTILEEKTFPFEIKSLTEEGTFEGYAAIFDKPDLLNEIVERGAFTKSLKETKQFPMLWYHDPRNPIGIVTVEEDKKGLKVLGELNLDVQSAKEKYALMKQKAIRGLSFGFKTIKDLWEGEIRRLKEVKLYEVSPVTFQLHPKALIKNVKQEKFETFDDALEAFKALIKAIAEFKGGEKNYEKLVENAEKALNALLETSEPQESTRDGEKGLLSSIIEVLEKREDTNKPHEHLFRSTIETLEKSNTED